MSKLMWIAGILLVAIGLALGVLIFASTASVVAWGVTLEAAAILLVGGFLCLGLGSVISGVHAQQQVRTETTVVSAMTAPAQPIPEFGRRLSEPAVQTAAPVAAAAAATATAVASASEEIEVSAPVKETIQALEQARQKIEQAFDAKPAETSAAPVVSETVVSASTVEVVETVEEAQAQEEAPAEEEAVPEEAMEEGQLYVVEERIIRGRPARILSDETVEAETDEGWMRFENLEHLDEYLDAMAPART